MLLSTHLSTSVRGSSATVRRLSPPGGQVLKGKDTDMAGLLDWKNVGNSRAVDKQSPSLRGGREIPYITADCQERKVLMRVHCGFEMSMISHLVEPLAGF